MSRPAYYEDIENHVFEFDTKTGDMILRFSSDYTQFDTFRAKLEGGDLQIAKREHKRSDPYEKYGRLVDTNPDPEVSMVKYNRYNVAKGLHFTITLRANAKRKFKFFSSWLADASRTWVPDPKEPTIKDRYGYSQRNGRYVSDWDKVQIHKNTDIDRRWEDKFLRSGYVYF